MDIDINHIRAAVFDRGSLPSERPGSFSGHPSVPYKDAWDGIADAVGRSKSCANLSEAKEQRDRFYQLPNDVGGTQDMTKVSTARLLDDLPGEGPILASPADHLPLGEKPKKKKSTPSSALVRPEDITDAADSSDLLTTLLEENLIRIHDKNDLRQRENWASKEREKIHQGYHAKALAAYKEMWLSCQRSSVGHSYQALDVKGTTVEVCQVCSYGKVDSGMEENPHPRGTYESNRWVERNQKSRFRDDIANQMNLALVELMKKRMVELDEEAGLLVWPKADDYDPSSAMLPPVVVEDSSSKVKKWFGSK